MSDFQSFLNCRAIIHDTKTNQTVADTHILETNASTFTITVPRSAFLLTPPAQVALLIPAKNTLYEYQGSIRRDSISARIVDIALYKGKQKEGRSFVRYALNTPVCIAQQLVDNVPIPFPEAVNALLVNISRQGCLLRAPKGFVNIGAVLEFTANQGDNSLLLRAQVLRSIPLSEDVSEFGCRLIPL